MNGVPKVELSLLDTGDRLQLDPEGARQMARHLCDAADRVEQLALDPSRGIRAANLNHPPSPKNQDNNIVDVSMIGIQLAGKNNRIAANVFARSLNNFLDLISDIDSNLSERSRGSVRWELASLQKNSPAQVEVIGVSRIDAMDYSHAIQESLLDGIDQLMERPEQPKFYSYSALKKIQRMAEQAKYLKWLTVFSGTRRAVLNERVASNVEYLIASGSKSLGSVRGSLDAITVHSGNEFRIWMPNKKRPVLCLFEKRMLPEVIAHLKQNVEVFGELQRNPKGEPVLMKVEEFLASEPRKIIPSVAEMSGSISDLYDGKSLKGYLEELRDN